MTPKQLNTLSTLCQNRGKLEKELAVCEAKIIAILSPTTKAKAKPKAEKPKAKAGKNKGIKPKTKKADAGPRAPKGELNDKITRVFEGYEDGAQLTSAQVFADLELPDPDKSKVSMALGYLARKGILDRVARGTYRMMLGQEPAEETEAAAAAE